MEKILDSMLYFFYIMSNLLGIQTGVFPMISSRFAALVLGGALVAGPAAWAQHEQTPASGTTVDIQGGDAWRRDPHMRQFYDAVVAAYARGPANVDAAALEKTSFAIFRDFAVSKGMNPDAMQDHLKLIPRQMIQIVKEDPKVLTSYDDFLDALFGPK